MAQDQFEVLGGQVIGEKAEMLREHQALIEEVGLQIPPTTVIASETVQANKNMGQVPNDATQDELELISKKYEVSPVLAVRSSAEGDASGNGIYESRFSTNTLKLVLKEAGLVIDSFSSDSAKDFRKQAELGEEFALMIQPVIGQDLDTTEFWDHFGPYLSGFGYSSSREHQNGYINVVAGIGGGVSRMGGQIITPEALDSILGMTIRGGAGREEGTPLSFYEFLEAMDEAILCNNIEDIRNDFRNGDGIFPRKLVKGESALAQYLIRKAGTIEYGYKSSGLLSAGMDEHTGEINEKGRPAFEFVESKFLGATKTFIPNELLEAIQKIEHVAGYPVYIEWALDTSEGSVQPVILQIAPAEQTQRSKIENEIKGDPVVDARHIIGHGVRKVSKLVAIGGPADIEHLSEFNNDPENEGYALLFGSALSGPYSPIQLAYGDCSKAGVLVEIQDEGRYQHVHGDIVQHLFGASRQTDKFIGEVTSRSVVSIDNIWARIHDEGTSWQSKENRVSEFSEEGSIHFLGGNFKVFADESIGKFVITESPE